MTKIDQFESTFKAATKTLYEYTALKIGKILIITDLVHEDSEGFSERIRSFLEILEPDAEWITRSCEDYTTVEELLELVNETNPDLICTYRNLRSEAWKWPYGIGIHLTVLTQATRFPVIVLPHPKEHHEPQHILENTNNVTVITDHLTGDHNLVNHAVKFTQNKGALYLTHVEDDFQFKRYIEIISKIPELETEIAEREIRDQLLKEPHDYIHSCADVLKESGVDIRIKEAVRMGHRLSEVKSLITDHETDLLVMNSKDEEQIAMHGLAYPLIVELRSTPILLL